MTRKPITTRSKPKANDKSAATASAVAYQAISAKDALRPAANRYDCVVIPLPLESAESALSSLPPSLQSLLMALLRRGDLENKAGKTLLVPLADGEPYARVLLAARASTSGQNAASSQADERTTINAAATALCATNSRSALWLTQGSDPILSIRTAIAQVASQTYRFDELKSKVSEPSCPLTRLTFAVDAAALKDSNQALNEANALANGMALARDLGNRPGNVCTPTMLAERGVALAAQHRHLQCKALNEADLKKLGAGSLLSVGAGSSEESRLIILEYRGGAKSLAPIAFVGKGITFDTGGISLKPPAAMDEMKFDMSGAGAVFGLMHAVAEMQLPINILGVVAAAENMPSGEATRPGDIVKSLSGQTIEILNTDAEGRLVLCDAITYVERFKPRAVIDIATLTGAIITALGSVASGLFANNDDLAAALMLAGETANDRAWRLPMWEDYQPLLKSNFADMANIGTGEAGSVVAACFLARFARNLTWAHLDVAGTAYRKGAQKGSTGRPIPLLFQYVLDTIRRDGANKSS